LQRANKSPGLKLKRLKSHVSSKSPAMDTNTLSTTRLPGSFLSAIAMIKGVMTTDICTINAVFELLVLFSASMQKMLLNMERPPMPIPIRTVLLLILLIRL